jgi:hypothetical protein
MYATKQHNCQLYQAMHDLQNLFEDVAHHFERTIHCLSDFLVEQMDISTLNIHASLAVCDGQLSLQLDHC